MEAIIALGLRGRALLIAATALGALIATATGCASTAEPTKPIVRPEPALESPERCPDGADESRGECIPQGCFDDLELGDGGFPELSPEEMNCKAME